MMSGLFVKLGELAEAGKDNLTFIGVSVVIIAVLFAAADTGRKVYFKAAGRDCEKCTVYGNMRPDVSACSDSYDV